MHRGELQQPVVDAVVGEDHHRALRAEPACEQRLGQRAHSIERLAVAHLTPALAGPLGEKRPFRRGRGPMLEQQPEFRWVVT